MARILITGATGLIGGKLTEYLLDNKNEITVITRKRDSVSRSLAERVSIIEWDGADASLKGSQLSGYKAIIHLAGAGIADKRWSDQYKKIIYDSRIKTTRALVEAIGNADQKPEVFVCSSAVGIYGDCGNEEITEEHHYAEGFLADVCKDWEAEAEKVEAFHVRRVSLRTGVVLSTQGGALKKMLLPFKLFIGGPLGSGKQWFPWIHIEDIIGSISFALENKNVTGALNLAAPESVRMRTFAKLLGKVLGRPALFPVPKFVLKIIMGEAAEATLASQKVIPAKLISYGYRFQFPALKNALQNLLQNN